MFEESEEDADRYQAERREYVKNIGIEYRYGCYEEKRADSCQLLAEYKEAIEQNFKGAYELFKKNCEEKKFPKSCFKYAMYRLAGRECEPSLKAMIEPLTISCEANMPKGCRYLSLVYWNGEEGKQPNPLLAEKYMKRACELQDAEACWLLSTWYLGPDAKFVSSSGRKDKSKRGELPRNIDAAIKYGIEACDLNCYQSCANVSRIYRLGDGVDRDPDKGKFYWDKAKEIYKRAKEGDKVDLTG